MSRIRFEDSPSTNTPITAENLDKLNNLVISPTQPTTGEEVWFKKGKNLFKGNLVNETINAEGVVSSTTTRLKTENFILTNANTIYTISCSTSGFSAYAFEYDADKNFIRRIGSSWSNLPYTFTTGATTKYILIVFNKSEETITPSSISNIQLEQNSVATTYESYIEKEIYCKNENGIYEKFLKEEKEESITLTHDSTYCTGIASQQCIKKGNFVFLSVAINLKAGTIGEGTYRIVGGLPLHNNANAIQGIGYVYTSSGGKIVRVGVPNSASVDAGYLNWFWNTSMTVQSNSVLVVNMVYSIN